jgi:hypothetical protein
LRWAHLKGLSQPDAVNPQVDFRPRGFCSILIWVHNFEDSDVKVADDIPR